MTKTVLENQTYEGLTGTAVQVVDDDEIMAVVGFMPHDITKCSWMACYDNINGEWIRAEDTMYRTDYFGEVLKAAYAEMCRYIPEE